MDKVKRASMCDVEAYHNHGEYAEDCSIRETEHLNSHETLHMDIPPSSEEVVEGDWYKYYNTSPTLCSPPGKQQRMSNVEDVLEDNTQHMDMLEQDTQGQSQAPGRSMWEDFICAVRSLPACEARGGSTEDRLPCCRREHGQRSHTGLEEVPK